MITKLKSEIENYFIENTANMEIKLNSQKSNFSSNMAFVALLNLFIVGLFGCLMRYKIGFDFPYFNQKNLQHAHSHFAFAGWVSLVIYLFIRHFLTSNGLLNDKNYRSIIITQWLFALGMLASFAIGGYNATSITFSTLTVLLSYVATYLFYRDTKKMGIDHPAKKWFMAALIWNAVSSIGTFVLAWMMISKHLDQYTYLASVYFFLHFQYNGWFLCGCIGILTLFLQGLFPNAIQDNKIYWTLTLSAIPAYGLSILWLKLPLWIYLFVVAAALGQSYAIVLIIKSLWANRSVFTDRMKPYVKYALLFSATAFLIKFLLQLFSVIPQISQLAFGFRPVVIAYLHLILLAGTTVFLLVMIFAHEWAKSTTFTRRGMVVLLTGIFLNELLLAIQGIASFDYIVVPYVNSMLLAISIGMALGMFMLLFSRTDTK
ncbi:MAG: hypothetical protein IPN29_09195 [Saprospiraceae bacterium]|nr:hypothetical protein [Saprospiraceae bacterium]